MNKVIGNFTISTERLLNLYNTVGKLITGSLEEKNVINAIMDQVELFFKPDNWSLMRLDQESKKLYFVIAKGIDPEVVEGFKLELGEGIAGKVAQTGKPAFIQNVQDDPDFTQKMDKLSGFKTRSIIAVPLIFKGQILGVIELINICDGRIFTYEEFHILETIADFSAIALNNSMTHERIAWLAKHDPLTKLYNFSHLDSFLQNTVHSSKNKKEKISQDAQFSIVVLIDINNFKDVNDIYGHFVGDKVLVNAAFLLSQTCRDKDVAVRIGGDEFLLVIIDLQEKDLQPTSARIREQLTAISSNIKPATGFSFGLVTGHVSEVENLIKQADVQMYENKKIMKDSNCTLVK